MNKESQTAGRLLPSEIVEVPDLVQYGPGAVVSRTLLADKGGTVTLFAFDAGQGLSEHSTPYDAFVQVLEGDGEFIIAGGTREVRAGQAIIMPANVPHAVRALTRLKMLLMMVRS